MNIIDAIKSGKKFRRPRTTYWHHERDGIIYYRTDDFNAPEQYAEICSTADLISDDWEIEEEQITLTRSQFARAFAEGIKRKMIEKRIVQKYPSAEDIVLESCSEIFKELGFKE